MAIQTIASPADAEAVIIAFVTFCAAEAGFTNHGSIVVNTLQGTGNLYRISRTRNAVTTYWGFLYDPPNALNEWVRCRMMRELPTQATWLNINSGSAQYTHWTFYRNVGPFTRYTFYTDTDSVFAVIEMRPNVFTHMGLGNITTVGTMTEGEFISADMVQSAVPFPASILGSGVNPNTFMLSPNTSSSNATYPGRGYLRYNRGGNDSQDFAPFGSARLATEPEPAGGTLAPARDGVHHGRVTTAAEDLHPDPFYYLVRDSNNQANFRAGIYPCYIMMRDDALDLARTVGFIPNIGCISLQNLNAQELVNTDWRVYPRCQKDGGDLTLGIGSGVFGLAYREIP